jgi:RNA polymerase sigma-70 factor (ECF subfamily)
MESMGDLSRLDVMEDRPGVVELVSEREKIQVLGEAIGSLPARCREVMFLHKIKGLPQREVAAELGLTEKIVEHEVTRGVKRCRERFRKAGLESF